MVELNITITLETDARQLGEEHRGIGGGNGENAEKNYSFVQPRRYRWKRRSQYDTNDSQEMPPVRIEPHKFRAQPEDPYDRGTDEEQSGRSAGHEILPGEQLRHYEAPILDEDRVGVLYGVSYILQISPHRQRNQERVVLSGRYVSQDAVFRAVRHFLEIYGLRYYLRHTGKVHLVRQDLTQDLVHALQLLSLGRWHNVAVREPTGKGVHEGVTLHVREVIYEPRDTCGVWFFGAAVGERVVSMDNRGALVGALGSEVFHDDGVEDLPRPHGSKERREIVTRSMEYHQHEYFGPDMVVNEAFRVFSHELALDGIRSSPRDVGIHN